MICNKTKPIRPSTSCEIHNDKEKFDCKQGNKNNMEKASGRSTGNWKSLATSGKWSLKSVTYRLDHSRKDENMIIVKIILKKIFSIYSVYMLHYVKTQYLHFRFHANYFNLPLKGSDQCCSITKGIKLYQTICTYILPQ